jgi:hypothetical protein
MMADPWCDERQFDEGSHAFLSPAILIGWGNGVDVESWRYLPGQRIWHFYATIVNVLRNEKPSPWTKMRTWSQSFAIFQYHTEGRQRQFGRPGHDGQGNPRTAREDEAFWLNVQSVSFFFLDNVESPWDWLDMIKISHINRRSDMRTTVLRVIF